MGPVYFFIKYSALSFLQLDPSEDGEGSLGTHAG